MSGYTSFACSGAGVLGISYVGVLKAYEEIYGAGSVAMDFRRCVGVSAGSLMGICLSLGFTVEIIEHLFMELNFSDFADQGYTSLDFSRFEILDLIANTRGRYGLNSGNFMRGWVDSLVSSKMGGKRNATFSDIAEFNPNLDLHMVITNLSQTKTEFLSKDSTPNMAVSDAFRISASIPIFFDVMTMLDHDVKEVMVDGGVIYNIPLTYFLQNKKFKPQEILTLSVSAKSSSKFKTLVNPEQYMKLLKNSKVDQESKDNGSKIIRKTNPDLPNFGWQNYIVNLITTSAVSQLYQAQSVANAFDLNYLSLDMPPGISTTSFEITKDQKQQLIDTGYKQALDFFRKKNTRS